PLSRMVAAMRVKSPFSQRAWFGFRATSAMRVPFSSCVRVSHFEGGHRAHARSASRRPFALPTVSTPLRIPCLHYSHGHLPEPHTGQAMARSSGSRRPPPGTVIGGRMTQARTLARLRRRHWRSLEKLVRTAYQEGLEAGLARSHGQRRRGRTIRADATVGGLVRLVERHLGLDRYGFQVRVVHAASGPRRPAANLLRTYRVED